MELALVVEVRVVILLPVTCYLGASIPAATRGETRRFATPSLALLRARALPFRLGMVESGRFVYAQRI